jgi:hypothetical protein
MNIIKITLILVILANLAQILRELSSKFKFLLTDFISYIAVK